MFKEILKEVQAIRYEVRSLKGQLLQVQPCRNCSGGKDEELPVCLSVILPVANGEEMLSLCKGLEDENSKKKLVILP
jgi:hypothetical protein